MSSILPACSQVRRAGMNLCTSGSKLQLLSGHNVNCWPLTRCFWRGRDVVYVKAGVWGEIPSRSLLLVRYSSASSSSFSESNSNNNISSSSSNNSNNSSSSSSKSATKNSWNSADGTDDNSNNHKGNNRNSDKSSSNSTLSSNNHSNSNSNNSGSNNKDIPDLDRKKSDATNKSRKLGSSSSSSNNKHNSTSFGVSLWNRVKQSNNSDDRVARERDKDSSSKELKEPKESSKPSPLTSSTFEVTGPTPIYTADSERMYKDDPAQESRWKSTSVFQIHGRVYEADRELLKDSDSKAFPAVKCLSLMGKDIVFPDNVDCDVKLIGLSFKKFGQDACKSWIHPFSQNFRGDSDRVKVGELLINEFQMLSGLQFMFVSGAKSTVPEGRWESSAVKVGGVAEVTIPLLLPNIYTGYIFLLDRNNMIRWRASGFATLDELDTLVTIANTLLDNDREKADDT